MKRKFSQHILGICLDNIVKRNLKSATFYSKRKNSASNSPDKIF